MTFSTPSWLTGERSFEMAAEATPRLAAVIPGYGCKASWPHTCLRSGQPTWRCTATAFQRHLPVKSDGSPRPSDARLVSVSLRCSVVAAVCEVPLALVGWEVVE